MCGRYGLVRKLDFLRKRYHAQGEFNWEEQYNICPTNKVPVVVEGSDGREIRPMTWGLIPFWAKEDKIKYSTINARADSVATKPAFRDAFKKRRCIIPASGFYEWKDKNPTWFTPKDEVFSFCGIWDRWKSPDGEEIESCSIITTDANELVGKVQNRMPCAVTDNMVAAWIAAATPVDELQSFLGQFPASQMMAQAVSKYVNKTGNKGPECIAPLNSA